MPLRYNPTGAARTALLTARPAPTWTGRRFFQSSSSLRLDAHLAGARNHYETLNVSPDASPAEIKKSFYLLSKRHHPDVNPSDPHAPARFMRISEAYATLSHAEKRARYDRDVMARHFRRNAPTAGPSPSYHSTGPAGGRPASGLSRRRGTYQGPPPSFYRSGGWGAHASKRRAAHEESTGMGAGYGTRASSDANGPPPPPPPGAGPSAYTNGNGWGTGGMGPGQTPYHDREVPHFDREAHERAQRHADARRAQRMAAQRGVNINESESATNVSFLGIAGMLVAIVWATFWLADAMPASRPRGAPSQQQIRAMRNGGATAASGTGTGENGKDKTSLVKQGTVKVEE